MAGLSSKLTKTGNFRSTICTAPERDYMLRRIDGIEEPVVRRAGDARKGMMAVAVEMVRGLHWVDFEMLADLMEQPTTGETAFVQIKSQASQTVLDDYLQRFEASGYDRFFFVCHSARGTLALSDRPRVHLFEGERLAQAAVKNGLFDWLIERSG